MASWQFRVGRYLTGVMLACAAVTAAVTGDERPGASPSVPHWAYVRPVRPPLPDTRPDDWSLQPIDRFTLHAMRQAGLSPAEPATREALLRRVTLDLTGVGPTAEEVEAFLEDARPDAYERVVDRLLASPRYGERMASLWLDAARYADTHGYHADSHRDMWLWRAWVIDALNSNMPFDRFTIEQLAGDLLPHATESQRIATGFHRNTMMNAEEGAIPEEYLCEYAADRVDTTATVWLAQTLACARCHDHKYDPYTQRDYYRMFAFFYQNDEKGLDGRKGNAEPLLAAPTAEQARRQREAKTRLAEIEAQWQTLRRDAESRRDAWEAALRRRESDEPPADAAWHLPLDDSDGTIVQDALGQARGEARGSMIWLTAGRFGGCALFDGHSLLRVPLDDRAAPRGPFSFSVWLYPTTRDSMIVAARLDRATGFRWQLELHEGRPFLAWSERGTRGRGRRARRALALRKWQNLVIALDADRDPPAATIAIDGTALELEPADGASEVTAGGSDRPVCVVGGREDDPTREGGFRGLMDECRYFRRFLHDDEIARLAGSDPIREILALPVNGRTPAQQAMLLDYYLREVNQSSRELLAEKARWESELRRLEESLPTTMIMRDRRVPRPTHILERGDYRALGEPVTAGPPEFLLRQMMSSGPADRAESRLSDNRSGYAPRMTDASQPANRLDLAMWIVDPRNPLTARVAVNRLWQMLFGQGLVRTSEDFGTRGEPPTHPELLDWLACQYIASGWDTKHMIRTLVLSATYRQSATVDAAKYRRDPENRWLARGPSVRLPAESIRDAALFAAGLLVERQGGPSVFPYQPEGLWEELAYNPDEYTAQRYVPSQGADLYRRSVYTFWKRTSPPPSLVIFDAPNRESCVVRRTRSNTPLQALVLMNDPTYVEAARVLAARVLEEVPCADRHKRVDRLFLRILGRHPEEAEVRLISRLWEDARDRFARSPSDAESLLTVGQYVMTPRVPAAEWAAWTVVAGSLMNLDEFIHKP